MKFKGFFSTILLALFLAVSLAGQAAALEKTSLMLDWYPNPNHVPFYLAHEKGFFKDAGLEVDIMAPADPNDPLKLVAAGKLDFAISYEPSVIMARAEGLPVVSIAALVQHPLSTILYLKSSGIKTPADLKGGRIGYSVEPLYRILFEAVAQKAGLKPGDYEMNRVGYNLSPPLLTGQADAVIGAFRNYEAIQIELEGKEVGIFPLEEHGVPDFYELVIITHPETISKSPEKVRAFLKAVTMGIEHTLAQPEDSLKTFFKSQPDLNNELNRRAFEATVPFFKGSPKQEIGRWEAMQKFMKEKGLIEKETPVSEMIWMDKN